jgi:hypothetical protein
MKHVRLVFFVLLVVAGANGVTTGDDLKYVMEDIAETEWQLDDFR